MIRSVNLIPVYRRERRQQHRRIRRWMVLAGTYGVLLVAAWCGAQIIWGGPDRVVAHELEGVRGEMREMSREVQELQPRLAKARTTLAASQSIRSQPDWSLLLTLLAELLGDDVVLSSCQLDPLDQSLFETTGASHFRLRLSGLGRSQSAVSAYVLRLEQTQLFHEVILIDTRTEPFQDGYAVGFRIECELRSERSK